MSSIAITEASKNYSNEFQAVKNVNLNIEDGEFLVLVGPSGCGKSTLLRMIAGLEEISDGIISIGNTVVNDLSPKERDIAMVFQSYALYPHMTVRENVSFALRLAKVDKAEVRRRVDHAAQLLELQTVLDRKPGQLSGGQRQRVAMGRAIVRQPSVFLMDEPLSNLDAKLRVQMRAEITKLQRELGVTTIYVTHDQVEAMTMGTRVAVLRDGTIQQVETPQKLYESPSNVFVATFIGSPAMNLYVGIAHRTSAQNDGQNENGSLTIQLGSQEFTINANLLLPDHLSSESGAEILIGIRPEGLRLQRTESKPNGPRISVTVELIEALGADLLVHCRLDGAKAFHDSNVVDDVNPLSPDGQQHSTCLARLSPKDKVMVGDTIQLEIDSQQLHFFDPQTRSRIPTQTATD